MNLKLGTTLAAAGVGFFLGVVFSDGRVKSVKLEMKELERSYVEALRLSEKDAAERVQKLELRERSLHSEIEKRVEEARQAQREAADSRAAADVASERLRIALNTVRNVQRDTSDAASAAACRSHADTLARLLAEVDALAGESSAGADGAIRAGMTCTDIYNDSRAALASQLEKD